MSNDLLHGIAGGALGGGIRKPSIAGLGCGPVIIFLAGSLIFWNEGGAVKTAQAIAEGRGKVITVAAEPIDPANEGKLVHVVGEVTTAETLTDEQFGVSAPAIKLRRLVKMYQWKQNERKSTKPKQDGKVEEVILYEYEAVWDSSRIDSTRFQVADKRTNPGQFPVESADWEAKDVRLGAFRLNPNQQASLGIYEDLPLADSLAETIPQPHRGKFVPHDGGLYSPVEARQTTEGTATVVTPDRFQHPQIGDVQVSFQVVKPTKGTIIAQQVGSSFQPFKSKSGRTINEFRQNHFTAEELFDKAQSSSTMLTWVFRFFGCLVVVVGSFVLMSPLIQLAGHIPMAGKVLGTGIGFVSLLLGVAITLVIISVAWLWFHPLYAIIGLVLATVVILGITFGLRKAFRHRTT